MLRTGGRVAAAEGRARAPRRRKDRRRGRPGPSPADRPSGVRPARGRPFRPVRGPPRSRGMRMTAMTPDTPALEIDRLVRRYGRTDAVNGLSLTVERGAVKIGRAACRERVE